MALLTGAAVSTAVRDRPVVVVALRANTGPSETAGLPDADVVYEEFPAADRSRQLAVFQSRNSPSVGPVGPTTPLDRKVATVFGGVLAYSGGTVKFVKMLEKAPIVTVNALAHPTAFLRRGTSTSSTYAPVDSLRSGATKATSPKTVFSFSAGAGPTAGTTPSKATTVTVDVATGFGEEWTHSADRLWHRTERGKALRTADGGLAVANLIFQVTPYQPVYLKSSTGATVLTPNVLGVGSATVCSATGCIVGSWQRRGYEAGTNYFDRKRSAIRLSRGSTWVVLAPAGSSLSER
ncbi:MAG: DUF3048 domain-containing protein [Frankiaceae bacterium]